MIYIVWVLFFSLNLQAKEAPLIGNKYNLKDLSILAEEKDYKEFFAHFKDIRPALRDQQWKRLVDDMAFSFALDLDKKITINKDDLYNLDLIFSNTSIKNNEKFKNQRLKIGYRYFQQAFIAEKPKNFDEILNFWSKDPSFADYAMKFGNLIGEYDAPLEIQWSFYSKAFNGAQAYRYCDSSESAQIILAKLYSLVSTQTQYSADQILSKLVSFDCQKVALNYLKQEYYTASNNLKPYLYDLITKDSIGQGELDYLSFYYILSGPVVSQAFNRSWNRLEELKLNEERRRGLIEILKTKETLPDGLFSMLDQDKKSILIQFVYKNIPEYFDFYAQTCISYLKGEKNYSKGNPTLYCNDLFDYTERVKPELVNELLKFQYKQAKKF